MPDRHAIAATSLMVLALRNGLERALSELAQFHGDAPGPWLDEIEAAVVADVKSAHSEGVDMQVEATAMAAAIDLVSIVFAGVRSELTPGEAE